MNLLVLKRSRWIAAGVILTIVVSSLAWFHLKQPRFEGRTAREWVRQLVRNAPDARHALLALGPDAVPALADAVDQKQSRLTTFLESLRPRLPKTVARHLPRPYEAVARGQRAVEVLYQLGTNSAPAIPALIRDDLRREAWEFSEAHALLINIGVAGVPQFIQVLRSRDARERISAARYLGLIGPPAHAAVPGLARLIRDPDPLVQSEAVSALSHIGPAADAAIPGLNVALTTTNIDLRLRVVEALWKIGRDSRTTTPILLGILADRDEPNRPRAAALLGQMGAAARSAVPVLRNVTHEDFSYTRVKAEEALALIEQSAVAPSSLSQ